MKADRPSTTALLIARALVFLSRDPRIGPLIPAETVEASGWFAQAGSRFTPCLLWLIERGWFRAIVWWVERRSVPGMMLHYVVRKRCLEDTAREALREGCRQVVVLGAGFDPLALRLGAAFPDAFFLEIDHPATQEVKRRALAERGKLGANLELLPLDLAREGLEEGIRRTPRFDRDADTLFIAEGLLMYFEAADVDRILRFCREYGGPHPRLAFTFMERLEDGRIAFRGASRAVDTWLARRGEPFRWGVPVAEMPAYLEARGFVCRQIATPEVLRERYLAAAELRAQPLADGDHVCRAAGLEGVRQVRPAPA